MMLRFCGPAAVLAALAAVSGARAADVPADAAGAKTIADFIAAYAGEAALPSVEVKQDGSGYWVTIDVGAAASALKGVGVSYDPVKYRFRVSHQDDGLWRVETSSTPPLSFHFKDAKGGRLDAKVDYEALTGVSLIDPKLNWLGGGHTQAGKATITERGPALEEFVEMKDLSVDLRTTSGPKGLTSVVTEPIGHFNVVFDMDPKGVDAATGGPAKPVHVSVEAEKTDAHLALAEFQPAPILDAWRFAAAHPTRADFARDFAGLKSTLTALAADAFNLDENGTIAKLDVLTEAGPIAATGVGGGVTFFNSAAGAGFGESLSAKTLKLPDGMLPPAYAALSPTSFDIAFKASGFDVVSAVQEWLADVKLDGTGPILSDADNKKVGLKLWAFRPVVIEIAPSHIVSASYDLSFEGKVTIDKGAPTANVTIKARNFDRTSEALESAAGEKAAQMTPFFAMAKGLGKAQPDGTLVWVYTLGADKVMKVNGLPLGKSPY